MMFYVISPYNGYLDKSEETSIQNNDVGKVAFGTKKKKMVSSIKIKLEFVFHVPQIPLHLKIVLWFLHLDQPIVGAWQ